MNIHRPVFWHQGLFLQPQHFQLADLYHESLLIPVKKYLEPYFWGVGDMEIQKTALGNRRFDLLRGEFLFPDGTYTVFPGNAIIEARSFEEEWVEGGKPFTVLVGLKKWSEGNENVSVLPALNNISKVTTRFVTTADPEPVRDLHHTGPSAQVKRLYHALKIFWESETDQLGDYLVLPVGQLVRTGEEIALAEDFVPPSLSISTSGSLSKIIKEIRDEVAARSHQLEEYKTQKGIHTAEFGARDMVYLLALRSLNRYVPILYHFTEARRVPPWIVYGILRQLIGELSSFSEQVTVLGELRDGEDRLPGYDHERLWECFASAQTVLVRLLGDITAGPEYIVQLLYDGTYYAADLLPAIFEGQNRFYLVFRTEEDPKAVIRSLETIAKLSSRERLPILIARALPGLGMNHLTIPPQELPRRAGCVYFQIDHHGDQWASVQKGRNIALYWDSAPEDLGIELMVVGRS
jgi:type VI secretion system protein ImpJ